MYDEEHIIYHDSIFRNWYTAKLESVTRPYLGQRVIFQTQKGHLGVGPEWIQPDDQVVIFDGGETSFILREHITDQTDGPETWKLVGDCFLLRWMHGDYFGHTVVDEMPPEPRDEEEVAARGDEKVLVRETFVLC